MSQADKNAAKLGIAIVYLSLITWFIRPRNSGRQIIESQNAAFAQAMRAAMSGRADATPLCDCGDDRRLHSDPPTYTGELKGGWESDDL